MRRRILIAVLALGTVLGFTAGFASLRWHRGCAHHHRHRSAAFEQRVSELCAEAALRAQRERSVPPAPAAGR